MKSMFVSMDMYVLSVCAAVLGLNGVSPEKPFIKLSKHGTAKETNLNLNSCNSTLRTASLMSTVPGEGTSYVGQYGMLAC